MKNIFKKDGLSKAERKERKRVNQFVREKIYPLIISRSENINDLTQIVKGAKVALGNELTQRVQKYHDEMDQMRFGDLNLKSLEGKHDKAEQELIDILSEETLKSADFILTRWPAIMEHFVKVELQERKPETLKVNFE